MAIALNSTTDAGEPPRPGEKVLRHAVFFEFNEESSDDDIQSVIAAFRGLPEKIDAIADYQDGVAINDAGIRKDLTHCFLLSFRNEADRDAYLPHPAHKAFGGVLGPHLKNVFVIDYWGEAYDTTGKMLKHAVFFRFKPDADPAGIKAVEEAFADLPTEIETIKQFEWGTNNSPESHDDGFTHAFMVTFDSEADLAAYGPHEAHQALVKLLRPVLDEVRVMDFWVGQ